MNPIDIIAEYYDPTSKAFETLIQHGKQVAQKALACAEKVAALKPDKSFLEDAAKFFSKNANGFRNAKTVEQIIQDLKPYGPDNLDRFQRWVGLFE